MVSCASDQDQAYVRQGPNEQYLDEVFISLIVYPARAAHVSTHVCPHAGIIILRRLLLFREIPRCPSLYRLPGLQVDDRILVHLICVCQHLNVDLGMAVLNDSAKVGFDNVVLFGSP